MKLLIVFGLLAHTAAFALPGHPDSLLAQRRFFELRNELQSGACDKRPAWEKLCYQAFTDNFFHLSEASNNTIGILVSKYRKHLDKRLVSKLLMKKADNHLKLYQYRQAYETTQLLLTQYKATLDSADAADLRNSANIYKGLLNTGPQTTTINADTRISYKRDIAGLINIPVQFADSSWDFIFDTGANFSVISETYARKAQLQLLKAYFNVRAITGIEVKANLGVARAFTIGGVTIRNAVFIVFPDSALSFANGAYKINAIIGFPVIEQLNEVHIHRDGYIAVPKTASDTALRNFGLDELLPIISVEYQGDLLAFSFDTGANITFLNAPFYRQYKAMVDSTGKPGNMNIGGAGGNASMDIYTLPTFGFTIGGQPMVLKSVSVKTEATGDKDNYYYGNLGQDVMKQFDEMVINFRYMYVRFINSPHPNDL